MMARWSRSAGWATALFFIFVTPLVSLSEPPSAWGSWAVRMRCWPPNELLSLGLMRARLRGGGGILYDTPPMDFRGRARSSGTTPGKLQHQVPAARYPNSYSSRVGHAAPPQKANMRTSDTPWKGATTPHYIHAKPVPAVLPNLDGRQAFGEVVTVEATAPQTASVIWLHGLGDTGHTWSAVASWLQMPWCKFIFPTAPAQPVSIKQIGYAMPSWFDFDSLDMENVDEDTETMERSVAYLHNMIEREIRNGVSQDRIMLAGFAQGGVVALVAALKCRHRIGGVLALSSWLPRNFFRRSKDLSKAVCSLPIWFYHGTEDKVVKYEMGWDSYQRALDLGLSAQFKSYEGLGHEYASQEMTDVQNFFFRRIPAHAADSVPEPAPGTPTKHGPGRYGPHSNGARSVLQRFSVGGVAAHFNAPWHYAISQGVLRAAGLQVLWNDCQGGTTSMTQALCKGLLDMAVLSTDGAIAEIAQGADFKIVAPFVTSPLRYGVFVSAHRREIETVEELEGQVFAISRKCSLSHVMTYLHAQQQEWNPRSWDRTGSSLLEVGNLASAVSALQEGRAQGLLWEVGSAQNLVDRGDLVMLGECWPKWPSFVLAVRNDVLSDRDGVDAVRTLLDTMRGVCIDFQAWPGRFHLVSQKYGYRASDARRRLADMEWSCENVLSDEVLDEVAFTLVAIGILQQFPSTDNMFASLDQVLDDPLPYEHQRQAQEGRHEQKQQHNHAGGVEEMHAAIVVEQRGPRVSFQEPVPEKKKMSFKQRPPTPFPWDQARKLAQQDLQDGDDGERICKEKMYDSSDSSESDASYEPDFRKTDEGTVEMTGVDGTQVRQAVINHQMRGRWVKGGCAQQASSKPATPPDWKPHPEDEQISAILDRSVMMSSTTAPHRQSDDTGSLPIKLGQVPTREASEHSRVMQNTSPRIKFSDTPNLDARASRGSWFHLDSQTLQLSQRKSAYVGKGCNSEAIKPSTLHAQIEDNGSEVTENSPSDRDRGSSKSALRESERGEYGSASRHLLSQSAYSACSRSQTGPDKGVSEIDSLTSTNSGDADSEQQRQQKAALNLRKLRDSAVIRRTAAKIRHTDGPASQDDTASENRLPPLRPANLFDLESQAMSNVGAALSGAIRLREDLPPENKTVQALASYASKDAAPAADEMSTVRTAAEEMSSIRTQSEDTTPSGGQVHSLERHPAEFRHTLRKSVHKDCNADGRLMPPIALFGTDARFDSTNEGAAQGGVSRAEDDRCPICLEPTNSGQVHVTTCAHRFHVSCYREYRQNTMMSTRNQCPVCRTSQEGETRERVYCSSVNESVHSVHAAADRTAVRAMAQQLVSPPDRPVPEDEGGGIDPGERTGTWQEEDGLDIIREVDSMEIRGGRQDERHHGIQQSEDQSHRFMDTPFGLESQVQHVNPVLHTTYKASPLTGMKKGGVEQTGERRSWRSRSVGRSPPWAASMNPFSITVGRSNSGSDAQVRRPASPLPGLANMSRDEMVAAVDSFGLPQSLLKMSEKQSALEPRTRREFVLEGGKGALSKEVQHKQPSVVATLDSNGRRASKIVCDSMKNALEVANKVLSNSNKRAADGGCLLLAMEGLHVWDEDLVVLGNCNVTAEGNAVLEGTWLLKEQSSGTFDTLKCEHAARDQADSCVLVWGGPWLFDECVLGSNGGFTIECAKACAALLRRCTVGGIHETHAACGGVSVGGEGRCLLEKCKLVHIASAVGALEESTQGQGAAICAMGHGKLSLEQSTIQDCGYGVVLYDNPRVILRSTRLMAATEAAFAVLEGGEGATLLVQKTKICCLKMWANDIRPGRFEARSCDFESLV